MVFQRGAEGEIAATSSIPLREIVRWKDISEIDLLRLKDIEYTHSVRRRRGVLRVLIKGVQGGYGRYCSFSTLGRPWGVHQLISC